MLDRLGRVVMPDGDAKLAIEYRFGRVTTAEVK